jgi:predicted ATPase
MLKILAEAYGAVGLPAQALTYLDEATKIIDVTGERWDEPEMLRLRGDLLISTGDHARAEASYHRALEVASQQGSKLFELRAAANLARLWRDQGRRDEARDLLAPVYGWFAEGFDTRDLKEAKALLDELSS